VKSQQTSFLHFLLSSTPQLMELFVEWNYIMSTNSVFASGHFVASPLMNLRHLHLYDSREDGKQKFLLFLDQQLCS
jgi:hypothetical protein